MAQPNNPAIEKVPFSTYFLRNVLSADQNAGDAALTEWIGQSSVVEVLQRWKAQELDHLYHYAKLVEVVGFDLDREKWLRNVDQVMGRMRKAAVQLKPGNCTLAEYQMMKVVTEFVAHWGAFAREIVQAAPVPGDEGSEDPAFKLKMAYSLLLTALMNLQDEPEGFFKRLLRGPAVQRPSADGKIRLKRERLQSGVQSKKQHRRSVRDGTEAIRSASPPISIPAKRQRARSPEAGVGTLISATQRMKSKKARASMYREAEQSILAAEVGADDVMSAEEVEHRLANDLGRPSLDKNDGTLENVDDNAGENLVDGTVVETTLSVPAREPRNK